jgi:hypothetical protein
MARPMFRDAPVTSAVFPSSGLPSTAHPPDFRNADPDQGGFVLKRHPYTASETGGHKMSEGEVLYLGLVIGGFALFALVMGYVNQRQK